MELLNCVIVVITITTVLKLAELLVIIFLTKRLFYILSLVTLIIKGLRRIINLKYILAIKVTEALLNLNNYQFNKTKLPIRSITGGKTVVKCTVYAARGLLRIARQISVWLTPSMSQLVSCAVPCYTMPCVPCCAKQWCSVLGRVFNAVRCHAMQYHDEPWCAMMRSECHVCSAIVCHGVQCLHSAMVCSAVVYSCIVCSAIVCHAFLWCARHCSHREKCTSARLHIPQTLTIRESAAMLYHALVTQRGRLHSQAAHSSNIAHHGISQHAVPCHLLVLRETHVVRRRVCILHTASMYWVSGWVLGIWEWDCDSGTPPLCNLSRRLAH